jgi:hypothetical protein
MGFRIRRMERQYARAVMKVPRARWWDPRTWLAFMFWELRTIARAISDDGLADWKATGTIVIFEILAIVGLTNAAAVYLGRRLIGKGSPFIFLVAFAVAIVNIPAILGKRKRWDQLSAEFEGYSPTIRIVGGFVVVLLVVGAIIVAGHFGAAQHLLPR